MKLTCVAVGPRTPPLLVGGREEVEEAGGGFVDEFGVDVERELERERP